MVARALQWLIKKFHTRDEETKLTPARATQTVLLNHTGTHIIDIASPCLANFSEDFIRHPLTTATGTVITPTTHYKTESV
ncbi:Uncharacterized protein HZ326_30611 [Fusarium oxysporum f. sp. albedinis]|nr:Uncharacterized protein HZ326_30611 [Fusarium oxysporum f. sp. albedinis]